MRGELRIFLLFVTLAAVEGLGGCEKSKKKSKEGVKVCLKNVVRPAIVRLLFPRRKNSFVTKTRRLSINPVSSALSEPSPGLATRPATPTALTALGAIPRPAGSKDQQQAAAKPPAANRNQDQLSPSS